jgi:hypothetical protein
VKYEVVLESQLATEMKRWWWKIVFVVALYFWHFSTILHFYYRHLGTLCRLKSKLNTNDLWVSDLFFSQFLQITIQNFRPTFWAAILYWNNKVFLWKLWVQKFGKYNKICCMRLFSKKTMFFGMEWQIILFIKICKPIHTNLTFTLAHSFIPWLILKSISITLKILL